MSVVLHDVVQGSRQWWDLRIGTPTVSKLSRILTPSKLEISKSADAYAAELVGERLLGRPLDEAEVDTMWTARGTDLEREARDWYAFHKGVEVQTVGFVSMLDGAFGGSPDGLVGDDGGLEIKCRGAKMHIRSVMGVDDIADRLQVQGYLYLTAREWWDVLAYNPELPKRIVRVYRDPDVHRAIEIALTEFLERLDRGHSLLGSLGDVVEYRGEA